MIRDTALRMPMPTPLDWLPCHLSLPQNDSDLAGRGAGLAAARATYRYAYDKPNIRGLAMSAEVPSQDKPSPGWVVATTATVVSLGKNAAKVNGRPDAAAGGALVRAIHDGGPRAALQAVGASVASGIKHGPVSALSDYAAIF